MAKWSLQSFFFYLWNIPSDQFQTILTSLKAQVMISDQNFFTCMHRSMQKLRSENLNFLAFAWAWYKHEIQKLGQRVESEDWVPLSWFIWQLMPSSLHLSLLCSQRLGTTIPQKWHRHGVERVKLEMDRCWMQAGSLTSETAPTRLFWREAIVQSQENAVVCWETQQFEILIAKGQATTHVACALLGHARFCSLQGSNFIYYRSHWGWHFTSVEKDLWLKLNDFGTFFGAGSSDDLTAGTSSTFSLFSVDSSTMCFRFLPIFAVFLCRAEMLPRPF